MATKKKWFKRALRTLVYGEKQLWGLIKEKLTPDQVAYFEKEFFLAEYQTKEDDSTIDVSTSTTTQKTDTTEIKKKPKTVSKPKRRTTTTKKRTTTRRTKKEK